MEEQTNSSVLIVDDSEANIDIILDALGDAYNVSVVMDGESALDFLSQDKSDLILLDILMPGIDGFEVCRRLKADRATQDIPIIFITALDDQESERNGLACGAVDFITKPINAPVVAARVKNHLLLKHQRDQLKQSISILEHRNELLEQKAEIGIQAGGLAHDMANVLNIASYLEHILPKELPKDQEKWKKILEQTDRITSSIKLGIDICCGFTNYLHDIGAKESVYSFNDLLPAINMYAKQFSGKLIEEVDINAPPIKCKADQIKRVLVNLMINALQAVEGREKAEIHLQLWGQNGQVHLSFKDNGVGISPDVLPHIFEEQFTTKYNGTGLGLFLTKQIIDSHNGKIEVKSEQDKGTEFILSFPAYSRS